MAKSLNFGKILMSCLIDENQKYLEEKIDKHHKSEWHGVAGIGGWVAMILPVVSEFEGIGENLVYAWFRNNDVKKQEEEIRTKAIEVIKFLNLNHLTQELAGNLSGGQKKLLELGRTMMVDSKLVLLDEVGAGVNRTLLKDLGTAILRLNKEKGYTFCMIEHDMDFISRMCNPVIVMSEGTVLFEGTPEEVKKNEKVIESYLGRANKINGENN